jgi:hypothetical protein
MGRGWGYWHLRPQDVVGDGPGPILVHYRRPVLDRDGTSPVPVEVRRTESTPWNLVGDGASHIRVPYWRSVLEGDGSRPIPDKVLRSGMPVAHPRPFRPIP